MRKILNGLYGAAEWLAMAALCAIAVLVFAQVMGRVVDTLLGLFGLPPYGFLVPSLAEIAGFLLVGASFMALAGSLRGGAQIRVTLGLAAMPEGMRRVAEVFVLLVGAALAGFFFYYAAKLALDSHRFNELSYGIIAIPLWIPQAVMALGIGIFAVALLDDLFAALTGRSPSYLATEDGAAEEV
ncbi:TRAP transporter small permease [Nitratireductor aquimarinus]|uniref:TRAP transporter small permease n=1 Tax=Alphaproteobacteria TaxID=28211 RepID=UPI0019D398C6|nr:MULTISPECIES: TRAP transporter small permease [Alphaproteobacteria]MBY6022210.1 TRAP transporter small permease [Nitratireductor sp. DP7N14-4]MBN7757421.1 TRAP transporter small permease [Nitratireductor aquimarinus]MBN7774812.1 TRAP transporter small permease [Nitratireductor pacificus]MBN7779673.1 TRAP transporter small permease [Nitratireductor pacificus]MBN7788480.1 TRAP transporter small permease [Nitratireductor aquimarinus]